MKISIITVAYNSEKSIGHTIESILAQNVLHKRDDGTSGQGGSLPEGCAESMTRQTGVELEYLIIDGAGPDRTVEVAESYRDELEARGVTYRIISEPDEGIYDAMNKGIRLAEGDVIGLLNSDDWYEPDTLAVVADTFCKEKCDLMFADIRMHKADGTAFIKKARLRTYQTSRDWNHPTTFVKAQLYKRYPFRKLGIHDDYGFYLQIRRLPVRIVTVDKVLANFRMGGASNRKEFKKALKRIRERYLYCYRINGYSRWYLMECILMEAAKWLLG